MPGGRNIGANIRELNASPGHSHDPQRQKIAIALNEARRAGAKIPKKKRVRDKAKHPGESKYGD